jgi:serine/threonine protein kinase
MIVTSNLKNKNCIKCLGVFELKYSKVIILEQAINKDLAYLTSVFYGEKLFSFINIKSEKDPKARELYKWWFQMSESMVRFFFVQLLNALDYLHKMNFIHRDIKLEHLLITKNFQIKLADFALSMAVPGGGDFKLTSAGTSVYMGPEFFNQNNNKTIQVKDAFKIDYYAAGIVLYKLLFNDFILSKKKDDPIEYNELVKQIMDVQNKYSFRNRYNLSEDLKKLLLRLTDKDIAKRAHLSEIMCNPWIKTNEERTQFLYEIHDNDYLKFLIELQKIDQIKGLLTLDQEDKKFSMDKKAKVFHHAYVVQEKNVESKENPKIKKQKKQVHLFRPKSRRAL